ncbi:hypothetical protein SKAU_G00302180 [Synaphobranchus kaupii]|uniref:Uncharacterized protein n=1 Tax=Synaphobranchus kaupii TaxID=118154 RepID=A0A9Q1EVY5_SYNKA|nr:hypothetical protein SKAU_G00302180 [Synaphobranchus kaupii]
MSPAGCAHVNAFKVENWKQNLRVIYQCFVWSGTAETRRRKVLQNDVGWTSLRRSVLTRQDVSGRCSFPALLHSLSRVEKEQLPLIWPGQRGRGVGEGAERDPARQSGVLSSVWWSPRRSRRLPRQMAPCPGRLLPSLSQH